MDFTKKQAVLFDLDGTVIDSRPGIFQSLYYAFHKMGLSVPPKEVLNRFFGPSLATSFHDLCGFDDELTEQMIEAYREFYRPTGMFECTIYPGIEALMKKLKAQGKKVILATKKPEIFAAQILDRKGILPLFDYVAGAAMDDKSEHKDGIVLRAADALGVAKEDCVMIGDMRFDCIGARLAGIDCIGVTYGYGTKEELIEHGAAALAADAKDLEKLLLSITE